MNEIAITITVPAGHPRLGMILDALREGATKPATAPAIAVEPASLPEPEAEKPKAKKRGRPSVPDYTDDELRQAAEAAVAAAGVDRVRAVYADMKISYLPDLKPKTQRAKFIEAMRNLTDSTLDTNGEKSDIAGAEGQV